MEKELIETTMSLIEIIKKTNDEVYKIKNSLYVTQIILVIILIAIFLKLV